MALDIQMVGLLSNLEYHLTAPLQNLSQKIGRNARAKTTKKKPIPDLRITDKFVEDKKIIKKMK